MAPSFIWMATTTTKLSSSVLNADEFEAVIAITPGQDRYYYTLRGEGTFKRRTPPRTWISAKPIAIESPQKAICLGWHMGEVAPLLRNRYTVFHTKADYAQR